MLPLWNFFKTLMLNSDPNAPAHIAHGEREDGHGPTEEHAALNPATPSSIQQQPAGASSNKRPRGDSSSRSRSSSPESSTRKPKGKRRNMVLPECKVFRICGAQISFPYQPYPSQLSMMNHMIRAMNAGKHAMIESPTGSGKSLALLCAALTWQKEFGNKQRVLKAQINQVVTRFGKHNSLDKVLNTGTNDMFAAFNDCNDFANPKQKDHANASDIARAIIMIEKTVPFILEQCTDSQIPKGLTQDDVSLLNANKDGLNLLGRRPRIYFGSRTHKQVSQLIEELRRKTNYRPRTAVLGSRSQTCIRNKVLKSPAVDDACRDLVDHGSCGAYHRIKKLVQHEDLATGGDSQIWDLEDLVKVGKKVNACPYFASRELSESADIVFCPYNYILDPGVREAAGIALDGNVVILDEAHNIENAARDAGSKEFSDQQLSALAGECAGLIHRGILPIEHGFINTLANTIIGQLVNQNQFAYTDYETRTQVWPSSESVEELFKRLMLTDESRSQLQLTYSTLEAHMFKCREELKRRNELQKRRLMTDNKSEEENEEPIGHLSNGSMKILTGLLRMLSYSWPDSKFANDYRIAMIRKPNPELYGARNKRRRNRNAPPVSVPPQINVLAFWSLNPGVIFKEIAEKSRSVILTSGTLSPLSSYASELQVDFMSTLEANHVIGPDRCWAGTIACGPSGTMLEAKYQSTEQLSFQDDMGEAILSIVKKSPDGMLVFAPSYSLLNKLLSRWQTTGVRQEIEVFKSVFVEPQGGTKKDFEEMLKGYRSDLASRKSSKAPAARGAVMFAVYRGKVSEGIDFKDFLCRTVVNIGIPYPAFKDVKVMLKRDYNDGCLEKLGGQAWYEVQAFRATNQALGRCLRHKMDWGAIIMLEARFRFPGNTEKLSKWVRGRVQIFDQFQPAIDSLSQFYEARITEDTQSSIGTDFSNMQCDDDEDYDNMDTSTAFSSSTRVSEKKKNISSTLKSFFYKPAEQSSDRPQPGRIL